ncbi:FAD-dependent monooxygenase [Mycobacterium sp.]|uniref:FAD-dependent monooxygenase n=1 Tax=Mycobacterium sp. TaxID=1785 RepID=UPI002D5285FE|nr:FAD-dependent monooxygenase [Mycobacterium sp.]HZA09088.1 FAD-dependent monooxygenase [Mycobacterium sp.]
MSTVRSALVIGGGIAGPVAAAALHKAGIAAKVYEAYPEASNGIGGKLALEANGLAALEIIGAADAVCAAATPITRSVMSFARKGPVEMPQLHEVPPRRVIDRGDLHRILHERASAADVPFAYGKRLVGIDESDGGVKATFGDGSTARADILVGADGVRSTVRRLVDPQAPNAKYTGMLGFGGVVDADLGLEPGVMTFVFGRRAYYLYWPEPDGRVSWGANLPSERYLTVTQARTVAPEEWLRILRETYADDDPGALLVQGTAPQTLDVAGALHIMPPVPHWHRGRMVLVGDAVHAPSNSTGQGASLAIESAIEVARCLRDFPDASSAFAAYEGVRRSRVEKIAARGAKINFTKAPGPLARKLMPVILPLVFKTMNVEKTIGAETGYRIDWSEPVMASFRPT